MSAFTDQDLERLAELVADKLSERSAGELIAPAELARRIGRTREWIYDNAGALGAIRLGDGHRPRIWFRWPAALDRLAELEQSPKRRPPRRTTGRPRRQRPRSAAAGLLPYLGGPS